MDRSTTTDMVYAGSAGQARRGRRGWGGRRDLALAVLVGWALGVASVLLWAVISGGWYEHFVPESESQAREMVNAQGWELVSGSGELYLRRPRVRLPGIRGPILPEEVAQPTSPLVRPEPAPKAAAGPRQEPVSLAGTVAVQTTEPFHLAGGSYRVEWTATAPPDRNCFFRARLRAVGEEGTARDVASKAVATGQTAEGLAFVRSVSAGQYYLDLTPMAGERCRWTLAMMQE
ncbi:MAG: hypothetical protein HY690_04275 [Chloroflexi bacterium]|nr:hypothetical protein [Chloroflexota bacterium]